MANIIEINDISAPELEVFTKLTEKQLRHKLEPEKGIFIAESGKVIELALAAGCEPISLLMERRHITGQAQNILARYEDVTVYTGDRDVLAGLTGYKLTRGILCAMRRPRLPSVQQICFQARRVAVLDNITDAANIGGIFRSAAALGVDAVLMMRSCCDPLCRKAVRVSMGTVFQVPWTFADADWESTGVEIDFTYQVGIEDSHRTTGGSLRTEVIDIGNFHSIQVETVFRRRTTAHNQVVAVSNR